MNFVLSGSDDDDHDFYEPLWRHGKKKTSSHDLSSEIYNISLANKNTIGVDFLLHAKNPSMEGGQKGDTAQFGSSEAQHNSGQNIPTFASHTSETYNQAWGAPLPCTAGSSKKHLEIAFLNRDIWSENEISDAHRRTLGGKGMHEESPYELEIQNILSCVLSLEALGSVSQR